MGALDKSLPLDALIVKLSVCSTDRITTMLNDLRSSGAVQTFHVDSDNIHIVSNGEDLRIRRPAPLWLLRVS